MRPQALARVYVVTRLEASTAPMIIIGRVKILDVEICALIDPGFTHSYISHWLVEKLHLEKEEMTRGLCVSMPLGKTMITT